MKEEQPVKEAASGVGYSDSAHASKVITTTRLGRPKCPFFHAPLSFIDPKFHSNNEIAVFMITLSHQTERNNTGA